MGKPPHLDLTHATGCRQPKLRLSEFERSEFGHFIAGGSSHCEEAVSNFYPYYCTTTTTTTIATIIPGNGWTKQMQKHLVSLADAG
jgi:hypothetical protein